METGVFENASVTTNDGGCNIRVVQVSNDWITLSIAVDPLEPTIFKDQQAGSRVTVDGRYRDYYVDLHRVRGNIVDLAVYQGKK